MPADNIFRIDRHALHAPFQIGGSITNADACRIIWQDEPSLAEDANGDVTGNDQRRALQAVGQKYILDVYGDKPLALVDLRAGSCVTTLTHLLKDARQPLSISLLEPQAYRRDEYAAQSASRPHVKIVRHYNGSISGIIKPPRHLWQLLLGLPRFVARSSQDIALMLHSLHALKQDEIIPALTYAYRRLKPGGRLIVTYARQDISAMGQTCLARLAQTDKVLFDTTSRLYAHKKEMLVDGDICALLDEADKKHRADIESFTQTTRCFRATPEKLCYSMMMTEILPPDSAPFDPAVLDAAAAYLEANIDSCGIERLPENDPHHPAGWAAAQPQQVAIISKNPKT